MKRRTFLTRSLAWLAAGITATSLTGCGFHLRGMQQQALSIDALTLAAPASSLTDRVRRVLENAGVRLTGQAPLILNLGPEQVDEIALRGGDMTSNEIELHMTVPFSVQRRSDNAYLLDQGHLEAARTYLVNNDDPLVRDELRENALTEMRQDITRQLIAQLRALET